MKLGGPLWQSLSESLGGTTTDAPGLPFPSFEHLATDTRTLRAGTHTLSATVFIALKGARHDGHTHVEDAAKMGVRGFILSQDWAGPDPEGHVMRVPDTLVALQALGAAARQNLKGKVVGITGSNGKTTVKEWAHALAGSDVHVSRSPGSWNSQIGVPLALWGLDETAEIHLVEAGISMPGEMAVLANMIAPDVGVMAHFGDAHDAHFENRASKAAEKAKLFHACDRIVLGTHDATFIRALHEAKRAVHMVSWQLPDSANEAAGEATLHIAHCDIANNQTHLKGRWLSHDVHWHLPFTDRASIANALTAAVLMLDLGVPLTSITERLAQLQPIGMRLEHLSGVGGGTIINDTWNHDLDGLATALDALERLAGNRKKAVIISDFVPFDGQDPNQMERLQRTLAHHNVDQWVAVGEHVARSLSDISEDRLLHFDTTESLLDSAALDQLSGWNVLVKGARTYAFERIARALEANPHTTVFDLDLGRLAHNLQQHKDHLRIPIMGMVKAFAYGAGEAVAVELDRLGIDRLAVAFAEEGISLRKKGVQCPIMVLNADPQRFGDLLAWRLEPEVHRLDNLEVWARTEPPAGTTTPAKRGVHLKVETGMHRLGLGTAEWSAAGARCAEFGIPVLSIYSHLSAADDPAADDHTRSQLGAYHRACAAIEAGWCGASDQGAMPPFLKHIANTAGAARFPEARLDMVRIGLGLYGLDASETLKQLMPIGRFHTRVSHVHTVPPGEAVGYGAADKSTKPRDIATLPVGYADGLPRAAGNGRAHLFAGGQLCPTVGPVCMDGCMIDVTGLGLSVGDAVEIFGDDAPIEVLASSTGTIPYELLCRIPPRVRRRHLRT